jgi:predicted ATP-grasp superfamily ATP-dependent carboligase
MMQPVRVLILDPGDSRGALAGCRALGRAGWTVGVAGDHRSMASRSHWARAHHRVPPPTEDEDRFVRALATAVHAGRYDVVLPAGDVEAVVLSARRDEVDAVVPYASHDIVVRAFDKQEVGAAAARCGLAVPAPATADDVPVVVKGRSHASGRHEAVVARTAEEVATAVRRAERAGGALVQELLRGSLLAVAVVADKESVVRARAHQVATRLWPVDAGVSTRAATIAVDPAIAASIDRLVQALGWFGLAQLQFVVPADGVPRLIDFNGRLYGSLALADAAGVNLAAVWASLALDLPVGPGLHVGRPGRRYQWLEGDLRRAVAQRRGGLWRDVTSTLAYAPAAVHSILDVRDPLPAAVRMGELARRAARRGARR